MSVCQSMSCLLLMPRCHISLTKRNENEERDVYICAFSCLGDATTRSQERDLLLESKQARGVEAAQNLRVCASQILGTVPYMPSSALQLLFIEIDQIDKH